MDTAESHEVRNPSNEHFDYIRVNMHVLLCFCGRFDSGTWCVWDVFLPADGGNIVCALCGPVLLCPRRARAVQYISTTAQESVRVVMMVFRVEAWCGLVAKRRDNVHICM